MEVQEAKQKVYVAVRDLVGPYAISIDAGQKVFEQIAPALANGQTVELSFAGVVFGAPFLAAAIGQLLKDIPPATLNRLLVVSGLPPHGEDAIQLAIDHAERLHSSSQYREAITEILTKIAEGEY